MVSTHPTHRLLSHWLWLALISAVVGGLATPADGAASRGKKVVEKKAEDGENGADAEEKAEEDQRPVVLFFIMDGNPGPMRSTGCMMAVMASIGRVNSKLKAKSKDYEEIKGIAKVVFHQKRLDDMIRESIRNLRLAKEQRSKGVSVVFMRCHGGVGEPKKKKDRPKDDYAPRRYQAEITIECEACRVSLRRKRIRKKGSWEKKFEATYITPEDQPKDKPLENSNTAMQKVAEKAVTRFFASREKWLK